MLELDYLTFGLGWHCSFSASSISDGLIRINQRRRSSESCFCFTKIEWFLFQHRPCKMTFYYCPTRQSPWPFVTLSSWQFSSVVLGPLRPYRRKIPKTDWWTCLGSRQKFLTDWMAERADSSQRVVPRKPFLGIFLMWGNIRAWWEKNWLTAIIWSMTGGILGMCIVFGIQPGLEFISYQMLLRKDGDDGSGTFTFITELPYPVISQDLRWSSYGYTAYYQYTWIA